MKKSMLLSFVTAGAIIATSVGTYAAWDQTSASQTADLTFREPVSVTAAAIAEDTTSSTDDQFILNGGTPAYVGTSNFTVAGVPDDQKAKYEVKYTVKLMNGDTEISTSDYKATVDDTKTDKDTDVTGDHPITITITPEESAKITISGKPLQATVTGTLTAKPAA